MKSFFYLILILIILSLLNPTDSFATLPVECDESPVSMVSQADFNKVLKWSECNGEVNFLDGENYIGDFMNGMPHGNGTYRYKEGSKYIGEWKNGMRNGQGVMTYKFPSRSPYTKGSRNEGKWKNGRYTKRNINKKSEYQFCLSLLEIDTTNYERCLQMCEKDLC